MGIVTTIGKNLRSFRKRIGISQEQLAELAELHRTYIGAVERGEKNISAKNIEKIAGVLGVEPHLLLKPSESSTSESMRNDAERKACVPVPIKKACFNRNCILPYGLEVIHVRRAMQEFISFIGFINQQLHAKEMPRLERFLMPANFSSIVGEFMNASIPKYCPTLVKNQYHNGHPDLIPADEFPQNSVQYSKEGVEIKGSRHDRGWQGHNPEAVWLMVFHFDSNTSNDKKKQIGPKPFEFKGVYAAKLEEADWTFSGRSETIRRTISASVNKSGVDKMKANWVYGNTAP